jgi:hypothetical protein
VIKIRRFWKRFLAEDPPSTDAELDVLVRGLTNKIESEMSPIDQQFRRLDEIARKVATLRWEPVRWAYEARLREVERPLGAVQLLSLSLVFFSPNVPSHARWGVHDGRGGVRSGRFGAAGIGTD